ncbi:hypothetical protein AHiyo4_49430 [Arthrobacter sp. Hiyo4]|nr:hypothetical protein AHiyo4_49430 [Arthrobacter sp. Hiyo4]
MTAQAALMRTAILSEALRRVARSGSAAAAVFSFMAVADLVPHTVDRADHVL